MAFDLNIELDASRQKLCTSLWNKYNRSYRRCYLGAELTRFDTLVELRTTMKPEQGDILIARAEVVSAGKSQAVCHCDVLVSENDIELLCATALGTIVLIGK